MNNEVEVESPALRVIIYGAEAAPTALSTRARHPVQRLKRYSRGLLDTALRYVNSNTGLDYRNYLLPTTYNVGDYAIAQATKQLFAAAKPEIAFTDINWGDLDHERHAQCLSEAALLIIAGSGYVFVDTDGKLPKRIQRDTEFLIDSAIPLVIFGIGVNRPFAIDGQRKAETLAKRDERTLSLLLDRASLISVRDAGSQNLLQRYTDKCVRLTADPAFYYAPATEASLSPPEGRPLIGINFPFHGPLANEVIRRNLPRYAQMLRDLKERTNCRFRYFVHFDSGHIIPKLLRHYGIETEVVSGEPATLARNYRDLNLHIGGMLHSCILAASSGTPCIALAYDIKHAGFFDVIGMTNYCFDAIHLQPGVIVDAAMEALSKQAELRTLIFSRRKRFQGHLDQFIRDAVALISRSA